MMVLTWGAAAAAFALCALTLLRLYDARSDRAERVRLMAFGPAQPARFSKSMLVGLPEPAARFFGFTIAEGAALSPVSKITMSGQFRLGTADAPKPFAMQAQQVLAPPFGFLWNMQARAGALRLSGSDSSHWTRFRTMGLVPVARAGGRENHRRAAFGRLAIEAVIWAPASVLPGPGIVWAEVDENRASVTLTQGDLSQEVTLHVGLDGRPLDVMIQRWSNANAGRVWQLQPFGGVVSDFADFGGYRLPTRADVGHFFGTPDWFAFFSAEDIRFEIGPGSTAPKATRG